MATIKSYTDIEQAKKLAEILPIESADMYYTKDSIENYYCPIPLIGKYSAINDQIPCWSLSALLGILPHGKIILHDKGGLGYKCICNNIDTGFYDNPVDACVDMIIKLHNLKMLKL